MNYLLPEGYWFWEKELPPHLCTLLNNECEAQALDPHRRKDAEFNPNIKLYWMQNFWGFGILSHYGAAANQQAWGMDLSGLFEVQFAKYTPESGGYDWHTDVSDLYEGNVVRKMTVMVQLSHPDEYEGGEVWIRSGDGEEISLPEFRQKGSVIVWPSSVMHKVSPVTKGSRKSLCGFFVGPPLR